MIRWAPCNPQVAVKVMTEELAPEALKGFSIVVMVDAPLETCIVCNNFCRAQNPPIKFIRADVRGACGQIFTDFGPGFVCNDVNGENPHSGIVANITNDRQAVITVPNDEQVEFGIGEWVDFKDVEGMTEINTGGPYKVVDTAMYNFKIDLDTTKFGKYERKSMNKYGTVLEAKVCACACALARTLFC